MIRVGIIGAETPLAGEVIRILIHHPETEITTLFSPSHKGRNISTIHHGLIGENPLFFSDKMNPEEIDFLILLTNEKPGDEILKVLDSNGIKLVIPDFNNEEIEYGNFVVGLSETNRKTLVRGATSAYIPSPILVPSMVSLFPLAHFLLLNSDIEIEVTLPEEIAEMYNEKRESIKLEKLIKDEQSSFSGKVNLKILGEHNKERSSFTHITLPCNLSLEEMEKIYDNIYDDHNFTFITLNDINTKEVEGTQKIIINLKKPDPDKLIIEVVSDARMRGGAGDIVHVMNLFFGLHEKTGLNLKPSCF